MKDVKKAIDKYLNNDYDLITSIVESKTNPYLSQVKIDNNGTISPIIEQNVKFYRRQDLPKIYDLAGSFYISSKSFILNTDNIMRGKISFIEIKDLNILI